LLTRAVLLKEVWHFKFVPETNVVDVQIGLLRRKVDGVNESPMIRSVRGSGFVLDAMPLSPVSATTSDSRSMPRPIGHTPAVALHLAADNWHSALRKYFQPNGRRRLSIQSPQSRDLAGCVPNKGHGMSARTDAMNSLEYVPRKAFEPQKECVVRARRSTHGRPNSRMPICLRSIGPRASIAASQLRAIDRESTTRNS
jgi:Transcriptional regulatory protein, C terminal